MVFELIDEGTGYLNHSLFVAGQSKHSPSLSTNKVQSSKRRERRLCQAGKITI